MMEHQLIVRNVLFNAQLVRVNHSFVHHVQLHEIWLEINVYVILVFMKLGKKNALNAIRIVVVVVLIQKLVHNVIHHNWEF